MKLGLLIIRVILGGLFIGHGTQKLFGWFGGHGLEGTAGFFGQGIGLRPGKRHATAARPSEALGGARLTPRAVPPPAAGVITRAGTTAVPQGHAGQGAWGAGG